MLMEYASCRLAITELAAGRLEVNNTFRSSNHWPNQLASWLRTSSLRGRISGTSARSRGVIYSRSARGASGCMDTTHSSFWSRRI